MGIAMAYTRMMVIKEIVAVRAMRSPINSLTGCCQKKETAEVTFEHVSEPTEVLNDQRSVQPVTGADQRLLFRIQHRIGTCRPHAVDDKSA